MITKTQFSRLLGKAGCDVTGIGDNTLVFVLPRHDNEGNDVSIASNHYINVLAKTFGGASVADTSGVWIDDSGVSFHDRNYTVTVTLSDTQCRLIPRAISAALLLNATHWKQTCLYVSLNGHAVLVADN